MLLPYFLYFFIIYIYIIYLVIEWLIDENDQLLYILDNVRENTHANVMLQ